MEIRISPEMEAQLKQIAANRERSPQEVAVEMLSAQLEYDSWFLAEVEKGRASIAQGRYIPHAEIERRYARCLEPDEDPLVG